MNCNVLILGAGGLGCEILKNLVMCQVTSITIVDMDTIELTNLNRQFLFRDCDIGKPKATTAVEYIKRHHPNSKTQLTALVADLTTVAADVYDKFDFVVSGLDAIAPRRFVNETLVRIALESSYEKLIVFIDSGTEGLKGHVKTIIPGVTACWECSIETLPKGEETVPMCTIANNPRNLKHVVEYVISVEFPPDETSLTTDDLVSEYYLRVLEACQERADKYSIDAHDLTLSYVAGIMKRIIPSVSTMNAMISAQACNEVVRVYHDLFSFNEEEGKPESNNFCIFNGSEGCFSYAFSHERRPDCPVCGE